MSLAMSISSAHMLICVDSACGAPHAHTLAFAHELRLLDIFQSSDMGEFGFISIRNVRVENRKSAAALRVMDRKCESVRSWFLPVAVHPPRQLVGCTQSRVTVAFNRNHGEYHVDSIISIMMEII